MAIQLLILAFFFQVTDLPIKEAVSVNFQHFYNKEIPNNTVFDIHEDEQGFIWIATQDGFARYEGEQFRIFRHKRKDKETLHDNICFGLTTSSNKLWVNTQTGIAVFDKFSLKQVDTLFRSSPLAYIQGKDSTILGINDKNIFAWNEKLSLIDTLSDSFTIGLSKRNQAFFTPKQWVYQKRASKIDRYFYSSTSKFVKKNFELPNKFTDADIFGFLNDSTLLLRNKDTIYRIDLDLNNPITISELITIPELNKLNGLSSYGLMLPSGSFWLAGTQFLAFIQKSPKNTFHYIPILDGKNENESFKATAPIKIYKDKRQIIWFGDQRNGLSAIDSRQLIYKSISPSLVQQSKPLSTISWSIAFNEQQNLALICADEGVYEFTFSKPFSDIGVWDFVTPYIKSIRLLMAPSAQYIDVAFFNERFYINAYKKGIYEYNPANKSIKKVYNQTEENRFYSVSNTGNHLVWSGYKQVKLQDKQLNFTPLAPDFFKQKTIIYNATFNSKNNELVFAESNSVFTYSLSDFTFKYILNPASKINRFGSTALMNAFGNGDSYWISTFGQGVLKINRNDTLLYSNKNGLVNSSIYNTLQDTKSNLWFSTNRGLHLTDSLFQHLILINEQNGFQNTTANQNGTEYHKNEILSIAGLNGVTLINANHYYSLAPFATQPKLVKLSLSKNGSNTEFYQQNWLKTNKPLALEISEIANLSISTSDFISANSPSFYRILPDSSWQELPNGSIELQLTKRKEGLHTIEVASENPFNLNVNRQKLLVIDSYTPFWESWVTRSVLGIFILVLTVFFVQRLVKNNYKKRLLYLEREQALFKEREHLSRDLHDSIGTQLSLIIRQLTAAAKDKDTLKRVLSAKDLAQFSLEQLRETIWALKSEEIYLNEYEQRIQQLAIRLLNQTGIQFRFLKELASNPIITPIQLIQSQRILEESLTNAIKYSETALIQVELKSTSTYWLLSITDFGKGFETNQHRQKQQYGLRHMIDRAKEIQAELIIDTELNKGTRIEIRVPI
jgi:signal transduction histidine kinase/ligand-binding sensor domain-containing protein